MAYQQYMTMEWIKENVKDPIPLSDKKRVHELLDILTHVDHSEPEICGAINALGMMSIRYGAFFIVMCGVIPTVKQHLASESFPISYAAAMSIKYIAQAGGCQELVDEGIDEILKSMIIDTTKHYILRNVCATSYGWIMANPSGEIKNYVIG